MADFTAKDVQALRQSTGVGMMDAKKALDQAGGDFEAATKWLREQGLAKAAKREDRNNSDGAVAIAVDGNVAAMVELQDPRRALAKKPGPACSWCALAEDCEEGSAWLTDETRSY